MSEGIDDAYEHVVGKLAELYRAALERGEVSGDIEPEAAAQVLLSLWEGHTLLKAFDPELDSARYLQAIETVLANGLVPGLEPLEGGEDA